MKKYLIVLLVSFSLVGCTNMNEMGQDVKDEMNEMGDDVRDDINDLGEGIQDYSEDIKDEFDGTDKTQPTSNTFGLDLNELWTVPSFCNATIGTTLFRGY